MKESFRFIVLMIFLTTCYENGKQPSEGYIMSSRRIAADCEIYEMTFCDDSVLMRISPTMLCTELDKEGYIKEFRTSLENIKRDYGHRNTSGDIIFEFYSSMVFSVEDEDRLKNIASEIFGYTYSSTREGDTTINLKMRK